MFLRLTSASGALFKYDAAAGGTEAHLALSSAKASQKALCDKTIFPVPIHSSKILKRSVLRVVESRQYLLPQKCPSGPHLHSSFCYFCLNSHTLLSLRPMGRKQDSASRWSVTSRLEGRRFTSSGTVKVDRGKVLDSVVGVLNVIFPPSSVKTFYSLSLLCSALVQ
ncbi:Uncharacterized protein Rs2_22406 [Raphanus sativus]|nr:Uncharacterized protein Rs2_22406 [Raphanus sativus]